MLALTEEQQRLVDAWLPGAELVEDLSWGLVDTTVLRLRRQGEEYVVKAAGPGNHHIRREIAAHRQWLRPWNAAGRAPRLVHCDEAANLLLTTFLPGELVEGSDAESEPDVYRQAGQLLAVLHGQAERLDLEHEAALDAKALTWLDRPHRIAPDVEAQLRERLAAHPGEPAWLVPTHGDWQPRNWLVDSGRVLAIDLGRADWRTPETDLARLAVQQFLGRPDLEAAFVEGYGADPRHHPRWPRVQLREAIGTAAWAFQVGDEAFEAQGHRMIAAVLAGD